jgi:3-hydroxy acid dehydrogenase/malonic semialdehyde reductase
MRAPAARLEALRTMEIAGRTALITGAGTGIGRATTLALARAGCRVVACGRRAGPLEDLARAAEGAAVLAHILDVTDKAAVDALPDRLPEGWRDIGILVNNAGHEVGGRRRFDEGTADEWESIVETNVLGLMRVSRALVPAMVAQGYGHVVNIGSVSGLRPNATRTAYAASKHAVHGFSESLRMDFAGSGVRVTEIMPGIVRTEFAETRWGDADKAREFYGGFDDSMEPDDIAAAILYALTQPARVDVAQIVLMQSSMK